MIALALAALLMVQDPALDAHGDGSLRAPSAAAYRSASAYDLMGVDLLDTPFATFALTLGSLPNPFELRHGFSLPIIELYWHAQAEDERAASQALLPGSGMRLPEGEGWHYALRLTGDAARLFQAEGSGSWLELEAPHLSAEGDTLTVATGLARPSAFRLYAVLGSYTPFSADGWQPISPAPSPWAFSSETQTRPVVDLLADSQDLQTQAIQTGVLPATVVRSAAAQTARADPWSLLMLLGSLTVLVGLVGRLLVKPSPRPALPPRRAAPREDVVLPTVAAYPGLDLDAPGTAPHAAPDAPEPSDGWDEVLLDDAFPEDTFPDDVPAADLAPTDAPSPDPAHDEPTSPKAPLEHEVAALNTEPPESDSASSPLPSADLDRPTNVALAAHERLTLDRADWLEAEDDPLDDDWERGTPKPRA